MNHEPPPPQRPGGGSVWAYWLLAIPAAPFVGALSIGAFNLLGIWHQYANSPITFVLPTMSILALSSHKLAEHLRNGNEWSDTKRVLSVILLMAGQAAIGVGVFFAACFLMFNGGNFH
jgi:hypothetical protein